MIEKKIKKYVICTLDCPTLYLKTFRQSYWLLEDIEGATKFLSKKLANKMIEYYRTDTRDERTEFVVIPVQVTYELLEEIEEGNSGCI